MTVKEIQSLLSPEALVLFAVVDSESYVLAMTQDGFAWRRLLIGSEALSQSFPPRA